MRDNCIYTLDGEGDLVLGDMVVIKELSTDTLSFYRRLANPVVNNGIVLQGVELQLKKVKLTNAEYVIKHGL
ncbi:hypothetical protein GJV76_11045 [Myroides sp. BIT-d1]|uniref:Uncharacterized protein n=1 Tax=Myroides albus TaxID=2562892 RepID=A0A6I3LLT7_9FLAO|nr:hypothetical protein [Myroides albus]